MGLALADVEGNGQKNLVVASHDKIQVFRWKDNHLDLLATYQDRNYRHWVSVDAADLAHLGHDEIFASAFLDAEHRPRTVVLRYESGSLKAVADIEGFARSIDRADGGKTLVVQNIVRSRELQFDKPAEMVEAGTKYKVGRALKSARLRDNQLFGFTFGDWDKDAHEDLAMLESGDHLRVFFKDAKWSSRGFMGGQKMIFRRPMTR